MAYNKLAVQGYFNFIKSVIPAKTLIKPDGFFYLPQEIYDPSLDFEKELKSYLVLNNKALNLSITPWIAIVWNRHALKPNPDTLANRSTPVLRRNLTNVAEPKGQLSKLKEMACPLDVVYYSNSIDYLETFEEYLHVRLKDITAFDVLFPSLSSSPFKVAIKEFEIEEFLKEERTQEGEICKIETSLDLCYPVDISDGLGDRSLIGRGKINIDYKILDITQPFPVP